MILEKAVKLTKTEMDDQLLETVKGGNRHHETDRMGPERVPSSYYKYTRN